MELLIVLDIIDDKIISHLVQRMVGRWLRLGKSQGAVALFVVLPSTGDI